MEGLINGLIGGSEAPIDEAQIENMSDTEFDGVIDGLGRFRNSPNFRNARRRAWAIRNRKRFTPKRHPAPRRQDSKNQTGKTLFENRLAEIENKSIRTALEKGKATVSDFEIYATKLANGVYTEMFMEGDVKIPGISNINNSKLRSGSVMLVTHISVLEAVAAGVTPADAKAANFNIITAGTSTGEFSFQNGQKTLISDSALAMFKKGEMAELRKGEIKLEVPKMIQDATEIAFIVQPGIAPVANTFYRVLLRGVITNRA